jgi:hypothetical protein
VAVVVTVVKLLVVYRHRRWLARNYVFTINPEEKRIKNI